MNWSTSSPIDPSAARLHDWDNPAASNGLIGGTVDLKPCGHACWFWAKDVCCQCLPLMQKRYESCKICIARQGAPR